jgi:hypothetical protein
VLGIPGLGQHGNDLQIGIAAALAWGLTQLATQMGDLKWLKGHHLAMVADSEVDAAALQAAAVAPPTLAVDAEHEALMAIDEDLPGDDEEFAAPPPDETNMPIQPSQFEVQAVPA